MRRPPENDRQPDFFVPGLYDVATKDNRSLMDVALFRLSKRDKRAGEVIRYELTDGYVEVSAGAHGMASIWDYDIVLMMVSHLTESMNLFKAGRGQMPGRKFVPHTSDIAKFCRRGDGGRQADDIEAALDRLQGTMIKSVRETPSRNGKRNVREVESEGLIGLYRVVSRTDTGKVSSIEITAPDWIYREVTSGAKPDVLTVHPDYFLIEPGLGRFVYRLARRAAGKTDAKWAFKTIYERSGSAGSFKEFCRMMRKLIEANDLPEYALQEEPGQKGPLLLITRRSNAPVLDEPEPESDDGAASDEQEPEA
jgi:plasmid replication initiation protein